ncbi:MAG: glucosyl-3-phosphoglycerate synthase [Actinomycetota bacterium]|nr:glucosyl-3-phosphoglycerate synthase [Actinomycetota bacterium]
MVGSFDARDFPPARVLEAKRGQRVSVCVPARNEADTIAQVVEVLVGDLLGPGLIDEVVVVDDASTDATAALAEAAGAVVWDSSAVLRSYPSGPGKGEAMWRAVHVTDGDIVAFCDADVRQFDGSFVLGLIGPLLERSDLGVVKAHYRRSFEGRPGEGGRVTELMARPLIATLFPHLSSVVQPLAGEVAARREVLEAVPFAGGYAVDLGLLIDVSERCGADAVAQCNLGQRIHRNRPLAQLGPQALAILQVALDRAGVDPGTFQDGWVTSLTRPDAPDVAVSLVTLPPLYRLDADLRPA